MKMIHETRIVPLDGRAHLPPAVRQWLGDLRGRWEGDTLVVETTTPSPSVDRAPRATELSDILPSVVQPV